MGKGYPKANMVVPNDGGTSSQTLIFLPPLGCFHQDILTATGIPVVVPCDINLAVWTDRRIGTDIAGSDAAPHDDLRPRRHVVRISDIERLAQRWVQVVSEIEPIVMRP